ncbi:putative transcriptional regulator [Novosphingobium chloroacetimidivorans]|uniref:Putative transcriptional regulator n=1 Tax=Novosphingobium chloroacetimidivorans TaxID=1428314 RepID=A0A7W7NWT0_9SPHN|nr:MucR family transcriptional regulator [Novosphingobium chloroacetimidivorans]MBB4859671.1 putative transcriptional regulator [Novosphingobium chloroacetimidivorans]
MNAPIPSLLPGAPLVATPGLTLITAEIVRAYVSNNETPVNELPALIKDVHAAVAGLGEPATPAAPALPEPAVSIRASVKPDKVTCLECGFSGKMLKRHLANEHQLTPVTYRARWRLSPDHPLVAPNYAERRRELAHKIGLGKPKQASRGRKPLGKG